MKTNIIKLNERKIRNIVAESLNKIIKENEGNLIGPGDPEYAAFLEKFHEYQAECKRIDAEFMNSLTPEEKEYISQGGNWIGKLGREMDIREKKGLTHPQRPEYKKGGLNRTGVK